MAPVARARTEHRLADQPARASEKGQGQSYIPVPHRPPDRGPSAMSSRQFRLSRPHRPPVRPAPRTRRQRRYSQSPPVTPSGPSAGPSNIIAAACDAQLKLPIKLIPTTLANTAGSCGNPRDTVFAAGPIPAQSTKMSNPPDADFTAAKPFATLSTSLTSTT